LSDTRTEYLLELARLVSLAPRGRDPAPILEVGTRAGGSALLMLRVLDAVTPRDAPRPLVLTVDPYGGRPYEGAPFHYDERHFVAMKRTLARYPNHVHYMMDSELFLGVLDRLCLWIDGVRRPCDRFSLVYLDGSHEPGIVWGEITRLLPMIVPGGFLVVDDTDWFEATIRKRLDQAAPGLRGTLRHHGKQSIIAVPG
jgi:predicted O-methyltransferase YrrM